MKRKTFYVATALLCGSMLTSSCVGSFSLFNSLASWNKSATSSKFLNEIIFIVISPAYAVCSVADVLVLNSIEFWSGTNPIASNIGKTINVKGEDGRLYGRRFKTERPPRYSVSTTTAPFRFASTARE